LRDAEQVTVFAAGNSGLVLAMVQALGIGTEKKATNLKLGVAALATVVCVKVNYRTSRIRPHLETSHLNIQQHLGRSCK
jgi:hypothetical protein